MQFYITKVFYNKNLIRALGKAMKINKRTKNYN